MTAKIPKMQIMIRHFVWSVVVWIGKLIESSFLPAIVKAALLQSGGRTANQALMKFSFTDNFVKHILDCFY